jgi:putative mRNA 3-end processing factor
MLLETNSNGIYCQKGDFYIDPWKPVKTALITHAHSDHGRWGHQHYIAHKDSIQILKHRLGEEAKYEGHEYNEEFEINGVKIQFHPAGHTIGSAQIKIEAEGEIWLVTGDFKLMDDGFTPSFEFVETDYLIMESTFALPVFNWQPQSEVITEINQWWKENQERGLTSLLLCYSLGKSQRILANLDNSIGKIYSHGAVHKMNQVIRDIGYNLPKDTWLSRKIEKSDLPGSLVIAPSSVLKSSWTKKLKPFRAASVSGWTQLRGIRRRRGLDRGFVISDHADWKGLNQLITKTNPKKVYVTHGYSDIFVRWLNENGTTAEVLKTDYSGEVDIDQ